MKKAEPLELSSIWRAYPHTLAARLSNFTWKPYPYLRHISIQIAQALARGNARIIVNMPPRHGKSELTSIFLPIWYLQNFRGAKIILASYSGDLASDFGRRVRNEIKGAEGLSIELTRDSSAASRLEVQDGAGKRTGKMLAVGVGGSTTGKGANLMIIDDPYKDAMQAASAEHRAKVEEWWNYVARSRLETSGSVILVSTRWHEKDLCEYVQAKNPGLWQVFKYPAIAEENDPLGRKIGEPLNPELFDRDALAAIKHDVQTYAWASLYQQSPIPREGGLFKRQWWKWYEPSAKPNIERIVQFWDFAQKPGITNDWSVCATWGQAQSGFYLLDIFRQKMEQPDSERAVINMHAKWKADAVIIEDKSAGSGIIQAIRRNTQIPVLPFNPGSRDKQVRATAATPTVEAGKCFLPSGATFVEDFVTEHEKFPKTDHDDQVDTTSMMVEYFQGNSGQGPRVIIVG